ncbi:MAG: DUF6069 family protein [Chloroflexota bacterium]
MTGRIIQGTILGVVLALVFNWLAYLFGQSRGVSYLVLEGGGADPTAVSLGMILLAGSISIIIGAVILWVLGRFTDNPLTIFLWISAIVLLVSLFPVYQASLGMGTFAILGITHIITAVAGILGLAIFFQRCDDCVKA